MNPVDLEIVADQFEADWKNRSRSEIETILESNRQNVKLLIELVHADLELRLKSGESARIESYLEQFPELKLDNAVLESLIRAEFWIRERREPGINLNEFVLRFPENYLCLVEPLDGAESSIDGDQGLPGLQDDRSYVSSRFSMERIFAEGGLGNVWLAHDHELDREVALKEIKNKHSANPKYQDRFVQEALITGSLDHPGVAPVYSLGQFRDGRPYYAMRLIRGKSLRSKISEFHESHLVTQRGIKRNLEFRRLLKNLLDACNTIEFAHSKGIIHRDIKPANIMIGQYGETLVVDWGLARQETPQENSLPSSSPISAETIALSRQRETTIEGQAMGSPAFMSPEQARGEMTSVGFASDVYSLGASLYNLVTGQVRPANQDLKKVFDNVRVASELRPLLSIACVAMSDEPKNRFQSPKVFAENVEHFLANEPVSCHDETFFEKLERQSRRHSGLLRTVAIAAVVVAVLAIVAVIRIDRAQRNTADALRRVEEARAGEQHAKDQAIAALKKEEKAKEAALRLKKNTDDLGGKLIEMLVQFGPANRGVPSGIERQLDILREGLPEESTQLEVQRLQALGQYEKGFGNLPAAVESFDKALKILVATQQFNTAEYARLNLNLASAYYEQGQTEKAESCLEIVFSEAFSTKAFSDIRVGALSLSAEIERDRNKLDLARHRATDALQLSIETFGKDDFHTQIVTDQLAGIYSLLNDHRTARKMFEELIDQQLELGLQNTRAGLTARRNYGVVLLEERRVSQALEVFEAVVADRGRIADSHDLETLDARMMLGHAKYHLARLNKLEDGVEFDAAVKLLQDTFEQHVESFGIEHPQTGMNALYLIEAWCGTARFKNSIFENEQERIHQAVDIANQLRSQHGQFFVTCNRVDNQVSRYFEHLNKMRLSLKFSELAVQGIVGRNKNAKSFFEIDPRDISILSAHGKRCFKTGDFENAVFWINKIPENEERLYVLTFSLVQLSEFEKAREAYWRYESRARNAQRILTILLSNWEFLESLLENGHAGPPMQRTIALLEKFVRSNGFQKMPEEDRERLNSILQKYHADESSLR